jgi:hypothetical protein
MYFTAKYHLSTHTQTRDAGGLCWGTCMSGLCPLCKGDWSTTANDTIQGQRGQRLQQLPLLAYAARQRPLYLTQAAQYCEQHAVYVLPPLSHSSHTHLLCEQPPLCLNLCACCLDLLACLVKLACQRRQPATPLLQLAPVLIKLAGGRLRPRRRQPAPSRAFT